ncbi:hypothetical protein ACFL2V_00060 [Pseudomonadota bacterium]
MPAPNASQLESVATAALQSAGIQGESASGLAKALAKSCGDALAMFLTQAQVMPGMAAVVAPSGSGSTAAPGQLMPPPAGGPMAAQLESVATAALKSEQIDGESAPALAKVIAEALAQSITLFTSQVTVAPGIAIAGFTTASPGTLM